MHTRQCLAKAVIAAVENIRDMDGITDRKFWEFMESNKSFQEAQDYLEFGIADCTCPPAADDPCNCEHVDHEDGKAHRYMGVPAGTRHAMFVGRICDECADGHMSEYLED